MIQTNELRIGNLIYNEGKVREIGGIGYDYVDLLVKPCQRFTQTVKITRIDPIPLTEEWLVKMGFEGFLGAYYHDSISVLFLKKPYVESDTYLVKTTSLDKITSVKFVHQCQNLIFTLTGQELTIKL